MATTIILKNRDLEEKIDILKGNTWEYAKKSFSFHARLPLQKENNILSII